MNTRTLPWMSALVLAAEPGAADSLSVTSSAVTATVTAAVNDQIRLPALEIETTIRGSCSRGSKPVSLSLSSADSVQVIDLDTAVENGTWTTVFALPADQVPPFAAREFCPAGAIPSRPQELRKEAFVSLRVNFRCSDGETERLTTSTALVDVDLICSARGGAADQIQSE